MKTRRLNSAKSQLRGLLHRLSIDIVPYSGVYFFNRRRAEIFTRTAVDVVADIGANMGQYGRQLRDAGYAGPIVSFEPVADAFRQLEARADIRWECHHCAIGAKPGRATLHLTANTWSSSFFDPTKRLVDADPSSAAVSTIDIPILPLDSFGLAGRVCIKIDTQGYELEVLRGAADTLRSTVVIEVEMSLVELYEGQPLMSDVLPYLYELGFSLVGIQPGFRASSGELLQLDALFARPSAL